MVAAIEESKDMSNYTFDELMCSLLAHEARIKKNDDATEEEKAFQVKGESSFKGRNENSGGKSRGGFRGRGRGGGRGRGQSSDQRHYKSNLQCHYCKKFGHKEADCWSKQKYEQNHVNYTEKVEEDNKLFHGTCSIGEASHDVWFIDSGCSNHMTGTKSLFQNLDESQKSDVRL